jgi:phosphoglycerate dehydrogenase-like enzyme
MKVLVTASSVINSPAALKMLEDAGHEIILRTSPILFTENWLIDQVGDIHALVVAMEPVTGRVLSAARQLKMIARPGVGYDTVDIEAATRKGIVVTIAAGTNHESVADFTFGLLLEISRGTARAASSVAQGGWTRITGTEAWRKTLVIIGLGAIGQAVARRALGFDMRVISVTRDGQSAKYAIPGIEFCPFEEALGLADFISLHAPLTDQTANLLDASAIAKMKPGAYVINTSRGGLVDENALAEAVLTGRLAGAAVDVLKEQGPGSASPLIGIPGIIVTPHMAAFTRDASDRVALSVARSILTLFKGERPEHVVNPAAIKHIQTALYTGERHS